MNQDISRRNFARILFDLRTEVRLSQKEMAKALGISTTSYQSWEGTSADRISTVDPLQLTIENFRAVATLKKTTVDLLLQEIEEKEADGQQPNPFDRSRVIALLRCAKSDERIWVAKYCLNSMPEAMEAETMCTVGQFIRAQLNFEGCDLEEPEEFDRFAVLSGFFDLSGDYPDQRDRLRDILYGRTIGTNDEIESILIALERTRQRPYTAIEVVQSLAYCQ